MIHMPMSSYALFKEHFYRFSISEDIEKRARASKALWTNPAAVAGTLKCRGEGHNLKIGTSGNVKGSGFLLLFAPGKTVLCSLADLLLSSPLFPRHSDSTKLRQGLVRTENQDFSCSFL